MMFGDDLLNLASLSLAFFLMLSATLACQGRRPSGFVTNAKRATFDPPHLRLPPLLRMELNQSDEASNPYIYLDSRPAVVKLLMRRLEVEHDQNCSFLAYDQGRVGDPRGAGVTLRHLT